MAAGKPNSASRKLSRILLLQRARTIGLVLLVLVPIFGLLLYSAHDRSSPVVSERKISGTVVRTIFGQGEVGSRATYVVVRAPEGNEVTAPISSQQALLAGAPIVVTERRHENGSVRYSFP